MARFTNGWVKIHRKAILGDIGSSFIRQGLFNAVIAMANLETSIVSWNGKPKKLERGELVTSLSELASLGDVDVKTVSRHLEYLRLRETINVEKCSTGTLIKVINFDKYQTVNAEGSKPSPNDTDGEVQTSGIHIEEYNNIRNKEVVAHLNSSQKFNLSITPEFGVLKNFFDDNKLGNLNYLIPNILTRFGNIESFDNWYQGLTGSKTFPNTETFADQSRYISTSLKRELGLIKEKGSSNG